MNIHANARLTPVRREELVRKVEAVLVPVRVGVRMLAHAGMAVRVLVAVGVFVRVLVGMLVVALHDRLLSLSGVLESATI